MKNTSKKQEIEKFSGSSENHSALRELFHESLKDIYWAEQALVKAIPKMAKKAQSQELSQALEDHLNETEGHVEKVEQVFGILGESPKAKKCEGMAGLVKEGEQVMSDNEGSMLDAGIIAAAQKVEHYEIASYGTLRTYAEVLGLTDAVTLLDEILEEEKAADVKLTELAEFSINAEAAHEEGEE